MGRRLAYGFLGLALANVGVWLCVSFTAIQMKEHWNEVLPNERLPATTQFALEMGMVWPLCLLVLCLAGATWAWRQNAETRGPLVLFVGLVLIELAFCCVTMVGVALPTVGIGYRMGGP